MWDVVRMVLLGCAMILLFMGMSYWIVRVWELIEFGIKW